MVVAAALREELQLRSLSNVGNSLLEIVVLPRLCVEQCHSRVGAAEEDPPGCQVAAGAVFLEGCFKLRLMVLTLLLISCARPSEFLDLLRGCSNCLRISYSM
ncbi:unnamed protein product [Symbiodinium sp. CCMP2456]|nr:unnamed protein product [Symbiodinium sp. CCMP2456]